jgi:hypothetical protein
MKTKPIFLILLLVSLACSKNGGTLSDSEKEKVISEVKPIVSEIIKGAEDINIDLLFGTTYNSPDYTYINGGKVYSYKELMDLKPMFATMSNQKSAISSEKYAVLDKTTVLYTLVARWEMNFKDGHSVIQEPWVNQFTFKKIDGKWKVVSVIESGYERADKVSKEPKELNQAELAKQFLGTWKGEYRDTTVIWDQKPFGKNGMEVTFKTTVKGKPENEGRQLFGYDNRLDCFIVLTTFKDKGIWHGSVRFNSKTKYTGVYGGDVYHPESASFRTEGELTSPDQIVEKNMRGDKVIATYTYTRVK